MATAGNSTMRSVHRAFDVLKALELAQQPLRLTELAQRAGLHVATTQRLVNVLTEHGYASRNAGGYTAGPAALSTAHAFATTSPLRLVARPVLEHLADGTGLTVSLYVRVRDHRVVIDRVERGQRPHYSLPIGERLPLYPGAPGKVLLACDTDCDLDAAAADVAPVTLANGSTLAGQEVRADLARVRTDGVAVSVDERQWGITALAVAIVDSERHVIGALGVSGNTGDLRDIADTSVPDDVRRAAHTIGARAPTAPAG